MSPGLRTTARAFYWSHLWVGVVVTLATLLLAVTGILLNHKQTLGLMPETDNDRPAPLSAALPLDALVTSARDALGRPDAVVDRMDVRPDDGLVKVRFDDEDVTEVTLALDDGRVLEIGRRQDVFIEKLHSGEIFGDGWILLSDAAAVALALLVLTGLWLWLFPRFRS